MQPSEMDMISNSGLSDFKILESISSSANSFSIITNFLAVLSLRCFIKLVLPAPKNPLTSRIFIIGLQLVLLSQLVYLSSRIARL